MTPFASLASRSGVLLLFATVSCGSVRAQTVDGTSPAASPIPVASVAPAAVDQPADGGIVHTDSKGRHLAPHGTLYLLQYVSATTDKGVEGFEPGAEVHFVQADRAKRTLIVSDGRAQVEVSPDKLTNDMDVAALARQKDQTNQARIAAYVQAEQAANAKAEREAGEATAKDLDNKQREHAAELNAEAKASEARSEQATVQANATTGNNSGYYGQGGYGYGSPYGFFYGDNNPVVIAPAATTNANVGAGNHAPAAGRVGGGKVK